MYEPDLGIPKSEIRARMKRVREAAAARGLDAVLVVGRSFYDRPGNLAYLTNHFPPFPATVFSGTIRGLGHAFLLLPVEGDPVLLVDGRAYRRDLVVVEEIWQSNDMAAGLVDLLTDRRVATGRVGLVGEDILPYALYRDLTAGLPQLRLEPAEELVAEPRMVKSPEEQRLLRGAAAIASRGLRAAVDAIAEGAREQQVCAAGTAAALDAGADFVRYLRVHSGPWAAAGSRWPQAMDRPMQRGEMVTLDIIGAHQGYQFDVLRTTAVGEATEEGRRLMDAVLRALEATVEAARPGAIPEDLVALAGRTLEEAGYGSHASTFVGHGIGLETVEEPYLMPGVKTALREDMVLCIEPGAFIQGWGGCSIEQEIIVRAGSPEVITDFPTKLW